MPISEYCKNCKITICLFCNRDNVHKGNKNDRVYYGVLKLNNWKNKIE